MKFSLLSAVLLWLLAATAVSLSAQPTDAERKQFKDVSALASKGDAEAQLALASLYARGIGVDKDQGKAVKWCRKAAEQGLARAQCLLGLYYASGEGIKKRDKLESARWLRRAADQGLAEGQYNLGLCYASGDGVDRNPAEAAAWFRKAADQALPEAESELGNCYLEGTGVPTDIPEGLKWTRRAAEQGFAAAQNTLGLCYSKGTGVTKDYVEAYKWFNLAAAKGGELGNDARVNLAMAERFLTPEQVAEGQRLARDFQPHKSSSPGTGSSPPSAAPAAPGNGFVNVNASDDSCEIYVDGGFVGNAPARVKLTAGTHVVQVKKPGYKDYRRQIQITEGSELTLRAVLEKQ
jgi:TPR repeat protein